VDHKFLFLGHFFAECAQDSGITEKLKNVFFPHDWVKTVAKTSKNSLQIRQTLKTGQVKVKVKAKLSLY
jgi:hypothetical protein